MTDDSFIFMGYFYSVAGAVIWTLVQKAKYVLSDKQIALTYLICQIGLACEATLLIQWINIVLKIQNNYPLKDSTTLFLFILSVLIYFLTFYGVLRLCDKILELIYKKFKPKSCENILPQNERNVNMLGEFIAHRRKELGLSQSKLARLSGHPVSSIHGIENGDNLNPRFEIIIDLCQVLDVSLDDMKTAFLENGKATETKK